MGLFRKKKKKNDEIESIDIYEELFEDDYRVDDELVKEVIKKTEYEGDINAKDKLTLFVEDCCDRINVCEKHIETSKKEYKAVTEFLNDINTIESLPPKMRNELTYYAKREIVLKSDKKTHKEFKVKMSENQYNSIENMDMDMNEVIKDMDIDEKECLTVKTDMNHLEGEKGALEYEKYDLRHKLESLKKIAGMITFIGLTAMFVMLYLIVGKKMELEYQLYAVVIFVALLLVTIFVSYRRDVYDLKMTEIKLNKAISLLNKYRLRYVNIKSKLDYQYEKNSVHNSYELANIYKQYKAVKKEKEKYYKTSDKLYEARVELDKYLKTLHLTDPETWSAQTEALIDDSKLNELKIQLTMRSEKLKKSIEYNMDLIDDAKEKIKSIIKKMPNLADEIMRIMEKYE